MGALALALSFVVQADDVSTDDFSAEDKARIAEWATVCKESGLEALQVTAEASNATFIFVIPCDEVIQLDNKLSEKPEVQADDSEGLPKHAGPALTASL